MKTLIRQIQKYLNMSQTEFAEHLNVTFATVNRWENGRAVPNKLAQAMMYEVCKADCVPVYDLTLERINKIAEETNVSEERILLYHGSKSGIDGKIRPSSRPQCDFGRGFYMGTEASQALTLICDYDESKLYLVSVDMKDLKTIEIPADINWAMLVAFNRGKMEDIKGTYLYEKYSRMTSDKDIVIGSIADDRMFYVIDNFFVGNITDTALVNSLSALRLGKQYVSVSQRGCDSVRIEKEIEISYLERLCMKDAAWQNREKGISLAKDICKNYRREGLFFDELLEQEKNGEE